MQLHILLIYILHLVREIKRIRRMWPRISHGAATLCCLIFFFILCHVTAINKFRSLTTCKCLGQNVTYECTVSGGAFTVWAGSAFMCQGREITLRHVGFSATIGECNGGAIIGRGINTTNNAFTSNLYVMLSSELIGLSIRCSVENGDLISVGSDMLTISRSEDVFPTPGAIYIEDIGPNQIVFSWSATSNQDSCPSLFYNISSVNCGQCSPDTTVSNSSSCINFPTSAYVDLSDANLCNLTVQSVICGNIAGIASYHLINLAVPPAPDIMKSVPHYMFRRANLIRLTTSFKIVESFNISNEQGIDGSATSYTVTYAESPSGKVCNTATIMASSCGDGICNHTFDVSTSTCSSTSIITTTVFASNVLGNGPNSSKVATDGKNAFVDVRFDVARRSFSCDFLNQSILMGRKVCIANITYGVNCDQHLGIYSRSDTSVGSSVTTPTIEFISGVSFYCISVSASDSNQTVIVEGNLDLLNIGQQSTTTVGVVAPVVSVTVVVCMIAAIIVGVILYQRVLVYTHKSHKEERIIKFTTSKSSSLTDVLQIIKNHGVSILSVNTHLHHTDVKLETKPGFIDNYVFCNCSKSQRDELKSEVENIEFFEDHQESDDTALVKCTVKVTVRTPGSILETLEVFNRMGIEILGVNTSTENKSVVCKCSEQEKKNILEDLKKMGTDSTDFSHASVTSLRTLKSKTSTRRIEFLVRPGASSIARALAVFGGCGFNITEINPDYVKKFDSDAPQPEILESQLVECVCEEGVRKELFQKLAENGAFNIHSLPDKDIPPRSNFVVVFSVTNEVGALARALKAFGGLDINILGVNTLGCADHSTLQRHLNYKKCKLELNLLTNEHQKELIKGIQATGIVVETAPLISPEQAAAERCCLQLLIEDPEDGTSISIPKALQAVFTVFNEFEITILGYEMDDKSACQREYQHNHVEYSCKNADEQHQVLIKELTATGIVKVLHDFPVDDDKHLVRNSVSCV